LHLELFTVPSTLATFYELIKNNVLIAKSNWLSGGVNGLRKKPGPNPERFLPGEARAGKERHETSLH
jgi:hypothetical protein